MTDKKTVTQPAASADTDSALKKEETVKGAGAKPARSTLDSDQKDKRKVKRENENRLLKAYLYIQSAKDKLEKTTEFLKRENAVLRRKLSELQAENAARRSPRVRGA